MSRTDREDLAEPGIGTGADDAQRRAFLFELRDAVSVRTFLMVIGVLLLQLGFILSYVGAFHAPRPVRIPIGRSSFGRTDGRFGAQSHSL